MSDTNLYDMLKQIEASAGSGMNGRLLRTRLMLKLGVNPDSITPDMVDPKLAQALREFAEEHLSLKL